MSIQPETDLGWGPNYGPWRYTLLEEPALSLELARLSLAQVDGNVHSVSLQPCPNPEEFSQDRYVVQDWRLLGSVAGKWQFAAVFDGHAGHETVDYTVKNLPEVVKSSLFSALTEAARARQSANLSPAEVADILKKSITKFDDSITSDLLELFDGQEDLSKLSDDEIKVIINDHDTGGQNSAKVLRCMRGSTVLISLVDPARDNLWVAGLGDCQAAFGAKNPSGWDTLLLSSNHNGVDNEETTRIQGEHPGEIECIMNDRVLGSIAVTRAVGDHLFKLPRIFTDRVFLNSVPGFRIQAKVVDIIERNLTPPYLSNQADVQHVELSSHPGTDRFLIMCSDGLVDLYSDRGDLTEMAHIWVDTVGSAVPEENKALHLLRSALGDEDNDKLSRMLTVEMAERWMDDTTILIQTF